MLGLDISVIAVCSITGLIVGYFIFSLAPTAKENLFGMAYFMIVWSVAFFVPLIITKAVLSLGSVERAIGYWILNGFFIFSALLGIIIRQKLSR